VAAALAQCEGRLDVDRMRAIWEDALAVPDWDGPPVWLHADLLPGNLLLRNGRVAGVLDFGAMATGDPAYDVTPAWHVLDRENRSLFRDRVQADEATWRRSMIATARRGITEVLADLS
jgi:aminoglycoside phosphotransferase (APT) family kinase protein